MCIFDFNVPNNIPSFGIGNLTIPWCNNHTFAERTHSCLGQSFNLNAISCKRLKSIECHVKFTAVSGFVGDISGAAEVIHIEPRYEVAKDNGTSVWIKDRLPGNIVGS